MGGRPLQPHGRDRQAASTQGQNYEVVTNVPRPTLEQIRAHSRPAGPTSATGRRRCPTDLRPSSATSPPRSPPAPPTTTTRSSRCRPGSAARTSATRSTRPSRRASTGRVPKRSRSSSSARGLLHPLRLGVRADGPHARHAQPHRRRLPAGQCDRATRSTRETVYSVSSGQLHAWPEVLLRGHRMGRRSSPPTASACRRASLRRLRSRRCRRPRRRDAAPSSSASPAPGSHPMTPDGASRTAAKPVRPAARVNPLPALTVLLGILFALAIPALSASCADGRRSPLPAAVTPRRRGSPSRMPRSTSASTCPPARPRARSAPGSCSSTAHPRRR